MITFVSKERGNTGSSGGGVVIRKLRNRKKTGPIVLLIVAIGTEILLESLVNTFSLSVAFRVVPGGEMELHVKEFSECPEEPGDKLRATIRRNMRGNTVFGEDMKNE